MTKSKRKKRTKLLDSDQRIGTIFRLTPAAALASPSDRCWKCKGTGLKFQKSSKSYDGSPCNVCNGEGIRKRSKRSKVLASAPGKILNLRGYPQDHYLRRVFPEGFAGPRAFWGSAREIRRLEQQMEIRRNGSESDNKECDKVHAYDDIPENLRPREGEIVGSLGCGDWRIYQIADGNKLTVDDFVCAWVAVEEMRKQGYGAQLHKENTTIGGCDRGNGMMFHADIGTGCGSVLMMTAWAFLGEIQSVGVEAQSISFNCLRRGLEWNLGSDGTSSKDMVQIRQNDLRTWDGCGVNDQDTTTMQSANNEQSRCLRAPYHLITGTPPYFPLDSFVASQNHEQKVRCRVPTRGGAPEYIEAASRFLMEESCEDILEREDSINCIEKGCPVETRAEGVFCMVEAAFDKAEASVLDAVKQFNMRVLRRVDVITRAGLPPRFSCWVMSKKNSSKTNTGASTTTTFNPKSRSCEEATKKNNEESKNDGDEFPIETLTLRNADFTRTKEYTDAMEIMGWVDFEKSKLKLDKSLEEIVGSKEEN